MNEFRHLFKSSHLNLYEVHCSESPSSLERRLVPTEHTIGLHRRGFCLLDDGYLKVAIDPNRACYMNPGEEYALEHPNGGGCVGTVLTISRQLLVHGYRAYGIEEVEEEVGFPLTSAPVRSQLDLLHRKLIRTLARGVPREQAQEITYAFFSGLLEAVAHAKARRPGPRQRSRTWQAHAELVNAVRAEMSRNLGTRPSLAALAERFGCSPFHLSRVFHHQAGLALSTYYQKLRLRVALERILDSGESLTTIAQDLGFTHHSHLTNSFKREYGVPPSACRTKLSASELVSLVISEPT